MNKLVGKIEKKELVGKLTPSVRTITVVRGIDYIEKTSTSGLEDTYTIFYTDGTTDTYIVTNGAKGDPGETPDMSNYYTKQEIDNIVGDINTSLDTINGEVI